MNFPDTEISLMDSWYLTRMSNNNSTLGDVQLFSEDGILSLVVILGSSISLVGLVFAFITYSLFTDLRSIAGTTLMNMLAALFLTQLLFVVGAGGIQTTELCFGLALSIHYSRLTVICWIVASTHDLYTTLRDQYILLHRASASLYFMFFKYSIFGWGLPLLLLSFAALIQTYDGGMEGKTASNLESHNCWFLSNRTFVATFIIPSCLLAALSIYFMVKAAVAAKWATLMAPTRKAQEKLKKRKNLQLFLFLRILIYVMLLKLLAAGTVFFQWKWAWICYSCGMAFQGIFVAFSVTCNCQVLKLYSKSVRRARNTFSMALNSYGSGSQGLEMSKSPSLQLLKWEGVPDPV